MACQITTMPNHKKKELVMDRIVLAGVVVGLCALLATPGFAQTNQACVLRCLDRGNLDQTCEARCTNGVPPATPPAANRTSQPAQQPAPQQPTAQQPAAEQPAAQQPAMQTPPALPAGPSALPPATQSIPQVPPDQSAPQSTVAQPAPQPTAAQSAPQQSAKPPAPPVNERCVLLCLDHGHLDQYCDRICALPTPGASPATPASGK
ncbi:MAG TPA: hypothetical protein VGR79_10365 [Stellaceae bacterium]|nr:hypothetical protein [Stellaceae bacterium]